MKYFFVITFLAWFFLAEWINDLKRNNPEKLMWVFGVYFFVWSVIWLLSYIENNYQRKGSDRRS